VISLRRLEEVEDEAEVVDDGAGAVGEGASAFKMAGKRLVCL
jgi:hypothetical protein